MVAAGLVDQTFAAPLKGGPGDTMNIAYISNPTAATRTQNAKVGRIYGFTVHKTTLVRAAAGGQADNWACHPLGVYYCSQQLKTNPPAWSPERDSDIVSMTHIYGYAEALQPPVTAGGGSATDVFNVMVAGTS